MRQPLALDSCDGPRPVPELVQVPVGGDSESRCKRQLVEPAEEANEGRGSMDGSKPLVGPWMNGCRWREITSAFAGEYSVGDCKRPVFGKRLLAREYEPHVDTMPTELLC